MAQDPYYSLPQCSNSDLSELNKLLNPAIFDFDYSEALRFGSLLDAMVTESHKVNVYDRTVDGEVYKQEDFDLAKAMKHSFYRDATCAAFMKLADCQKVSIGNVEYQWNNFKFMISARAKWDLFMPGLKMGADIKTTTATTLKQFEDACEHFNYFRSRVWYMNLENTDQDMLIGISKKNLKVFKIPIRRGDKYFQKGEQQASELAFTWWHLFENFNPNITELTIL